MKNHVFAHRRFFRVIDGTLPWSIKLREPFGVVIINYLYLFHLKNNNDNYIRIPICNKLSDLDSYLYSIYTKIIFIIIHRICYQR